MGYKNVITVWVEEKYGGDKTEMDNYVFEYRQDYMLECMTE